MSSLPEFLTDEAIERTQALGREMAVFLRRRDEQAAARSDAKVEPHPELLKMLDAIKAESRGGARE